MIRLATPSATISNSRRSVSRARPRYDLDACIAKHLLNGFAPLHVTEIVDNAEQSSLTYDAGIFSMTSMKCTAVRTRTRTDRSAELSHARMTDATMDVGTSS